MKKNSQGKKLISFALVFALLISLFSILPLTASAADAVGTTFKVGSLTYTVTDDTLNTVSVTAQDDSISTNVVIHESVENDGIAYKVTAIKDSAFQMKKIESVKLPNTLDSIPSMAFFMCSSLKEIEINSDVSFGGMAFNACTALTKVVCNSEYIDFSSKPFGTSQGQKSVTIYGYKGSTAEAFAKAENLSFIEIENPNAQEQDDTIFTWKKLNEEDGEDGPVEIVGFKAGNEKTSDVVIPSLINKHPVVAIGASAFYNNGDITKLTIPESVITIKDSAFRGLSFLNEVTFAENSKLETIEANAFAVSTGAGTTDRMSSIELPVSLKSIGDKAFGNRKALGTVRIFSNDVTFGEDVFTVLGAESSTLKLYGYPESTAETYAKANNYTFIYLGIAEAKAPLKELIDKAKAMDKNLYTKDSFAALTEAISAAQKVYRNAEATPTEVSEAISALQAVIDGLVPAQAETTAPVETTAAPTEATVAEPTEATTVAPETTAPVQTVEVLLGDADGSGKIDVKDVTHIQKHIASYFTLKETPALAADVDGNGTIDVNDATLIQKYLASYNVDYKIGEVVQFGSDTPAPTEEATQATEEQSTTAAQDTTTAEPEPTTAAVIDEPEPEETIPTAPEGKIVFFVTNNVSWLDRDGGKLWLYNDDTDEFIVSEGYNKNEDGIAGYFYFYMPEDWVNLSIYRTPFNTTKDTFNKDSKWDETTKSGIVLNEWTKIGNRGDNNAFKVTADKEGSYIKFDPSAPKPSEDERTIYFDNSQTKWSGVYIYGWSFGLEEVAIEMENEGNNIWSYTFYDVLPDDGVKGFLFTDRATSKNAWTSGTVQTVDLATEEGKNLFVPTPGNGNISGTWDVYTP